VASSLSLHKHAQTWSVLKTLYSENLPSPKASTVVATSGGGLGTTLGNAEPQSGLFGNGLKLIRKSRADWL